MTTSSENKPACKSLVLDAGPLLSLSPLRGLAETFYTVPQVLDELKDRRAREHFEKLGLTAGVKIQVQSPDAASLSHVIQFAKKTGDYSVLSHPDLCVLALTYALDQKQKEIAAQVVTAEPRVEESKETTTPPRDSTTVEERSLDDVVAPGPNYEFQDEPEASEAEELPASESPSESEDADAASVTEKQEQGREKLDIELHSAQHHDFPQSPGESSASKPNLSSTSALSSSQPEDGTVYDDPSDDDDGEGEWITPSNVAVHKSKALNLLPDDAASKKGKKKEQIGVGCMTADFAMQNVLLQMSLSLVGVEGKRIDRVKTWVLRCHACFKICKDNSRKFCPSCGNPTLLRASVTLSSPKATASTPTLQVHLKKNFQYKTRGTIYSIPAPKPGTSKTGSGEGLVLREDQTTWMRAKKHADGKREREEKRLLSGAASNRSNGVAVSSWMDPDWVPEILSTGTGGKGRSMRNRGYDGDMPVIGYGKKNPNERKRHK